MYSVSANSLHNEKFYEYLCSIYDVHMYAYKKMVKVK